jgi:tripartite ATP-independent transporter DctP family solute receptor
MNKKVFFISILITLVMLVSFLSDAKTVIRIGSAFPTSSIQAIIGQKFKEIVEAETDKIEVQVFSSGSLGSENEILEQLCLGSIEMQSGGLQTLHLYAHEYSFMDATPYLWENYNHWMNVWNSELGKAIKDTITQRGNSICLGVFYVGMRQTTANKPLKTLQDIQGLKLRLAMVPTWVKIWQSLGANPIPIAITELFSALQTGMAEASEGPPSQLLSFKLHEVQDYLIMTNHGLQVGDLSINKDFYEQLDPSLKEIVKSAGSKACKWAEEVAMAEEKELVNTLINKGMIKIIPDTKSLREKVIPALKELFEKTWTVTSLEQILSFVEE